MPLGDSQRSLSWPQFPTAQRRSVTSGRERYFHRILRLGVMLAPLWSAGAVYAADDSLTEIQRIVDQYTRKLETLEGHQRAVHATKRFQPTDLTSLAMEDLTVETDFKVDLVHHRTALATLKTWYYRELSKEPFSVETVFTCDGQQCFRLEKTLKQNPLPTAVPLNHPRRVVLGTGDHTQGHDLAYKLTGLPAPGMQVSLAAVLSAPGARVVGRATIDGAPCTVIEAMVGAWRAVAALDPSVSYLPRRLTVRSTTSKASAPPVYDNSTSEFRQFSAPAANESVWFPVRGRTVHMGTTTVDLEITELRVNSPLSTSDFQIDVSSLPPGVQIESPTETTYTGDRKDLWEEVDRHVWEESEAISAAIRAARESAPTAAPVTAAVPRRRGWIVWVLAGASAAMMAIGLLAARARR